MRNFGVEIEINSFDQRDFKKNPLGKNENPLGMDYVADLISSLGFPVGVYSWHQTHNNTEWICKSDSSCGIEICSPVMNNFDDLEKLLNVMSNDPNIKIDQRCSFHVHFNIQDCLSQNSINLASILAWWVKCEPVFFDSFPDRRKLNRYCQCIGFCDFFKIEDMPNADYLIKKLGSNKYLSCNAYHLVRGSRPTIEFRLAEESACLDFEFAKNWVELLSHFINRSIETGMPESYCWCDPKHVFEFLDFNKIEENKIRDWFLKRILKNINSDLNLWNINIRKNSILEINSIIKDLQLDKDILSYLVPMNK